MNIRNNILYGIMILVLQFVSCGKGNELEPSGIKENYFEVPVDAMDPESVLRRDFYGQEKIYLLFNDTLRHENIGKDRYGNDVYFTETVDLAYKISALSGIMYRFDYIREQKQKEEFAKFVKEYVFPGFSEIMRPYSILLIDSIRGYVKNPQTGVYELYQLGNNLVIGNRCTAIARNGFEKMTGKEKQDLATLLISDILTSGMEASLFTNFDKYGSKYNNRPVGWQGINDIKTVGFLEPNVFYGREYFPDKTMDRSHYVKLLIEIPEEEVLQQYVAYPIIIEKYYIMKILLEEIGYIIGK